MPGTIASAALHHARALQGDVDDALLVGAEHDVALQDARRVVEVHDRLLGALDRLVGAVDELLARLGQHLDGDVIRDQVLLDELRTKSKSVWLADGKPTSISL